MNAFRIDHYPMHTCSLLFYPYVNSMFNTLRQRRKANTACLVMFSYLDAPECSIANQKTIRWEKEDNGRCIKHAKERSVRGNATLDDEQWNKRARPLIVIEEARAPVTA